jgi:hypothetical protein
LTQKAERLRVSKNQRLPWLLGLSKINEFRKEMIKPGSDKQIVYFTNPGACFQGNFKRENVSATCFLSLGMV